MMTRDQLYGFLGCLWSPPLGAVRQPRRPSRQDRSPARVTNRSRLYCVLVSGGRSYPNDLREHVYSYLDAVAFMCGGDIMLIHGGARGIDTMCEDWAREREQICVRIPAQWSKYGTRAGRKRNAEMAAFSQANVVVVFEGGRGTLNMLSIVRNMDDPKPIILLPDGEFWK